MGTLLIVTIALAGSVPFASWQAVRVFRATRLREAEVRAPLSFAAAQQPDRRQGNVLGAATARPTRYFG